jgi:hypothetical protein
MPLLGKRSKKTTSEETTPAELEPDTPQVAGATADTEGHVDEIDVSEVDAGADAGREPDDTEGHGLDRMLGMDALAGNRTNRPKQRGDEDLKPLSKPWPRLKDEPRR